MDISYEYIVESLNGFIGSGLKNKIRHSEKAVINHDRTNLKDIIIELGISSDILTNASAYKKALGQIATSIHAMGILRCLPEIIEDGERIEYVSLGAGNTGREWDLETNERIAEFKFINWKGGSESVRQNSIFKDFFALETNKSSKKKYLYSLGADHPMKFFNSSRSIASVVSRNNALKTKFEDIYGDKYKTVTEYFEQKRDVVEIVDVSNWVPELIH